jgi:nucleoside-diphosphate-sugar epimerase
MKTLVIGSGLVGSQVARILVERGEKPVLMDHAAQNRAINEIVDLAKVTLIPGDVLRPLSVVDALRSHDISKIVHTAANPLLTVGAQKEPYSAINLNIMGTVNVLEAARVAGIKRVVVSSSSVLNHYLEGGEDNGDFGKEEAFPRPITFYAATGGAGSSSLGCGTGQCSDPGAVVAAADLRMLFARRCTMRSPEERQFSLQAQWSGFIPRMPLAAP